MAQINLQDATLYLKDGSTPQNSVEIRIGEGNLTFTENKPRQYLPNRGILDEVRNAPQVPMAVTMDFVWEYYKGSSLSGATPTPIDALKQTGPAETWVSADADVCRPYAVDVVVLYVPDCATGDQEEIILPDFRYETLTFDLSAGTIACAGNCNATEATVTRSAQSA